jgi:hypothetical protein
MPRIREYTKEHIKQLIDEQVFQRMFVSSHPGGYFDGKRVDHVFVFDDFRGLTTMAGRLGDGQQPVNLQTLVDTYYAELEDLIEYKVHPFIFCHPDSLIWSHEDRYWSEQEIPLAYLTPMDEVSVARYMVVEYLDDKPVTKETIAKALGFHIERDPKRLMRWYEHQEMIKNLIFK